MRETRPAAEAYDETEHYEIRLKGHLDNRWGDWFESMRLTHESDGTTILYGQVVDQAELHGLIRKVRDLGIPLISVSRVEPEQSTVPDVKSVYLSLWLKKEDKRMNTN